MFGTECDLLAITNNNNNMNLSDYAFGERSGGYTVSKPKPAAFYFHYNKPASMSAGEPRLSIHYRDQCMIVNGIECRVPVKSRTRAAQRT